jgi:hypothetical protein
MSDDRPPSDFEDSSRSRYVELAEAARSVEGEAVN